jgi:competence ComEA-like helix-hairpin-helix protein
VDIYKKSFLLQLFLVLLPVVLSAQVSLININTAGSTELQTLNGIGPAYAQRIIDFRAANGPFVKIDDIKKVSGIGDATFLKIKDFITIGETSSTAESSPVSTSTTADQITTSATSGSSQSSSNITTSSTHYSATPLTNVKPDTKFAIGAGRDRLGTVGTPIEFRAESNKESSRRTIFKWNFGDGVVEYGEVVNHSYLYAGEYVVVLNASGSDGQAVSRTNVRILSPDLAISFASTERIEIINNSKSEVNLYGRALIYGSQIFILPMDTIVKSGQKISFSSAVTGLLPQQVADVFLMVVDIEARPQDLIAKIDKERLAKIANIQNEIAVLEQRKLALSQTQSFNNNSAVAVSGENSQDLVVENTIDDSSESQRALVVGAVATSTSTKLNNWTQTIKRFFLRTQ